MSVITDKFKKGLIWAGRKVFRRKQIGIEICGYFNGICPVCETHIGIDIYHDKLTGLRYAYCARCKREIYTDLDKFDSTTWREW